MYKFVLQRFVTMLLVLVGVSIITFGLMHFTPGDPARQILRDQMGREPPEEAVQEFRERHGLNDPLPVQYANWIGDILHGDMGNSFHGDRTAVTSMIINRVPKTAELAVASMVIALLIAFPAGIISAVHQGQIPDYLSQIAALFGLSMPNFWLAYMLIIVFALIFNWLPVAGVGGLDHLILPAVTMGTAMAAVITRLLRSSMLEVLDEDYIRTARSKGLKGRIVTYKHALKNALIPVITIIGLQFGAILNGAVIVEIVFQRPGLGKLLIDSIFARDYPVVQGLVLVVAVIFVIANFLVDITYRFIDPRISLEEQEP